MGIDQAQLLSQMGREEFEILPSLLLAFVGGRAFPGPSSPAKVGSVAKLSEYRSTARNQKQTILYLEAKVLFSSSIGARVIGPHGRQGVTGGDTGAVDDADSFKELQTTLSTVVGLCDHKKQIR